MSLIHFLYDSFSYLLACLFNQRFLGAPHDSGHIDDTNEGLPTNVIHFTLICNHVRGQMNNLSINLSIYLFIYLPYSS